MNARALFSIASLASSLCFAVTAHAEVIDDTLNRCLEKDPSTAGQVQCYSAAEVSWDKRLNADYQSLRGALATTDGLTSALKEAQVAWLGFRDATFTFAATFYGKTLEGTMWRPVNANFRSEFVRDRVVDIAFYASEGEASLGRRESAPSPIEDELMRCYDRDGSTTGMQQCLYAAEKAWDSELNKVYSELRSTLPTAASESLKAAQIAWISYRDKERTLSAKYRSSQMGTIYRVIHASRVMEITKNQTEILQSTLQIWKDGAAR